MYFIIIAIISLCFLTKSYGFIQQYVRTYESSKISQNRYYQCNERNNVEANDKIELWILCSAYFTNKLNYKKWQSLYLSDFFYYLHEIIIASLLFVVWMLIFNYVLCLLSTQCSAQQMFKAQRRFSKSKYWKLTFNTLLTTYLQLSLSYANHLNEGKAHWYKQRQTDDYIN